MLGYVEHVSDPLWTVLEEGGPHHAKPEHLPPYLQRLEQTGRAQGAKALREKYAAMLT